MKYALLILFIFAVPSRTLAQWTHLKGPEWGSGWKMAQNGSVVYSISSGKLYKSEDEGFHWEKLDCPAEYLTSALKLLATDGGLYVQKYDQQLFRSQDDGKTWALIMDMSKLDSLTGRTKYDFFVKDSLVLLGDDRYILLSNDNGDHWNVSEDFTSQKLTRFFEFNGEFFAWGGTYVYRSSDNGRTWEKVYSTLGNILTINVVQNTVYLLYKNIDRIIKTTDGFRSWETVFPDETLDFWAGNNEITPIFFGSSATNLYLFIYSQPYCRLSVFASQDGGHNWVKQTHDSLGVILWIRSLVIFDDHVIMGLHNGLGVIGYDFDQPIQMNLGMYDASPLWIDEQGNQKFLSNQFHSYSSMDDGQSWVQLFPEYSPECLGRKKLVGLTKKRVVLIENHAFYLSEDNAANWTEFPSNFFVGNSICIGDRIWYHDYVNLYMLPDDSANPVNVEPPTGWPLFSSTFAAYDGGMILKMEDGPYFVYDETGAIIKSFPTDACDELQYGLKKVLYDGHTLLYFCNEHVYVFKENATEWEEIFPQDVLNSNPLFYYGINFAEYFDGVIWVGTRTNGLFFSTDQGERFYPYQPPFPDFVPISMQKISDKFWIGVEANGIIVTDIPPIIQDDKQEVEFKISPNPSSSGSLIMESNLFLTSEPFLELFDVSGQRLAAQPIASGQQWDISFPGLSIGVYYVKLTTAGGARTLKWAVCRF